MNILKLALHYLFFIQLKTSINLNLIFELKIDHIKCNFRNQKQVFQKPVAILTVLIHRSFYKVMYYKTFCLNSTEFDLKKTLIRNFWPYYCFFFLSVKKKLFLNYTLWNNRHVFWEKQVCYIMCSFTCCCEIFLILF